MLKKFGLLLGAAALMTGGLSATTASAEDTLNAAGCFPVGHPVSKPWEAFIKEVNERGKGVV